MGLLVPLFPVLSNAQFFYNVDLKKAVFIGLNDV